MPNTRGRIQDILDYTPNRSNSREHFIANLEAQGVAVRLTQKRDGSASGISYEYEGVASAGNKLGKDYSLKGVEQRIAAVRKREAVSLAATARYMAEHHRTMTTSDGFDVHEGRRFFMFAKGGEVQIRPASERSRVILSIQGDAIEKFAPSPAEYEQLCRLREAVRREIEEVRLVHNSQQEELER